MLKIVSTKYAPRQYLLLENRSRAGFDFDLPGEGLLVWRVDETLEQNMAASAAMLLIQADGKHQLETPNDWNEGDAGDPFPGSEGVTTLPDIGPISTSFSEASSKVRLENIMRDNASGEISLDIVFL